MKNIRIGNRLVGPGYPLYFIADIGANHDGDINKAFKLIELAKEAGADAAKFQHFQASKIVSKHGFEKLKGQLSHQANWKKSVYEVYQDASINKEWTPRLKEKCDEVGIDFFTSPYDLQSVDEVDQYVELYKIGSGDITWIEIIEYIGSKGKPVIMATGASDMEDIKRAVEALSRKTSEIVLLQCNTNYTLEADKYKFVNLNVLKEYEKVFPNLILGLSDHTLGYATVLGAVALGGVVFEKHFTDNNDNEGPDHKFAMNPKAWREMVDNANQLYYALGDGEKKVEENEKDAKIVQRRSLRATRDLEIGEKISIDDIEALRPITAEGLDPYKKGTILGKKLMRGILKGEEITLKDIIND